MGLALYARMIRICMLSFQSRSTDIYLELHSSILMGSLHPFSLIGPFIHKLVPHATIVFTFFPLLLIGRI